MSKTSDSVSRVPDLMITTPDSPARGAPGVAAVVSTLPLPSPRPPLLPPDFSISQFCTRTKARPGERLRASTLRLNGVLGAGGVDPPRYVFAPSHAYDHKDIKRIFWPGAPAGESASERDPFGFIDDLGMGEYLAKKTSASSSEYAALVATEIARIRACAEFMADPYGFMEDWHERREARTGTVTPNASPSAWAGKRSDDSGWNWKDWSGAETTIASSGSSSASSSGSSSSSSSGAGSESKRPAPEDLAHDAMSYAMGITTFRGTRLTPRRRSSRTAAAASMVSEHTCFKPAAAVASS